MTITSSGAITMDALRTEFPGRGSAITTPISLSQLTRGGGNVANHWNNVNIPTTTSNIRMSNFYGSGLNYKTSITVGFSGSLSGYQSGSFGSITSGTSQMGFSYSSTLSGTVVALFKTEVIPPKGGNTTYRFNMTVSGGDYTSTSWNRIVVGNNAATFYRTDAVALFSGSNTSWTWGSGGSITTDFTIAGNFYMSIHA